jgi:hypothetical protein
VFAQLRTKNQGAYAAPLAKSIQNSATSKLTLRVTFSGDPILVLRMEAKGQADPAFCSATRYNSHRFSSDGFLLNASIMMWLKFPALLIAVLFCTCTRPLMAEDSIRSSNVIAPPSPVADVPFELQPYRVLVSVALADAPGLDPTIRKSVLDDVSGLADRLLGEMWTVTTEENSWLVPVSLENLRRVTAPELPAGWHGEQRDKSFLVTIEQLGGQYQLSGREWDHVGRVLGPARTQVVMQRRELSQAVFRLVHDLFRPLLTIDRVTDGTATLTVKAGALAPADPAFVQLRKGQFWQPFFRFRNPKNEIEKLDTVPWTLLQVSEVNSASAAYGVANVVSGLRSPLPSRRRPRVDLFARAVQPDNPVTEFRLVSKRDPSRPLVGVVIEVKPAKDAKPSKKLLTDRMGMIRLVPQGEASLAWLFVRSGEKKLAQLPVVPGMELRLTAELPDDSIRLRVEGELSILESNLTDTVAQRAVLMARIRKLSAAGDWKSTRELQKELRQLPTTTGYLQELATIRLPAVQAAQADKDKSTVANLERVCDKVSKLIQKYLDEDKLKAFDTEMKELEREAETQKK